VATSVDGDKQRPGWDPADPPSPPSVPPWTGPADEAGHTRVADGTGAPAGQPGAYAAGDPGGFGPWPPARPPQRPSWPPSRRELVTALSAVLGLALLGAALGLLWARLAPRLEFRVVEPGRAVPVLPEAEEYVAADGRFVLITLAAGALAGLVCWLLRGSRGPLVLAALALGGLLGAVVTWRLGVWLEPGYHPADLQEVGRVLAQPLELRARAALVVEPIAAVVVYLLGAGFTVHNDLGVDPEPPPPPAG
jgi:MFS family permease